MTAFGQFSHNPFVYSPDLRLALRFLRRNPAFTIAIVLTLALGIGANAAAYNIVYNVLFRPLPFHEPSRLAQLWETNPALPQLQVTVPDYQDWRKQTHRFEQISAYTFQAMNRVTLIGPGEPETVQATMATHDLFSTLGVRPLLGRDFVTEDEQRKEHVALISENLWRRKFAGDPAVIGKPLQLETSTSHYEHDPQRNRDHRNAGNRFGSHVLSRICPVHEKLRVQALSI